MEKIELDKTVLFEIPKLALVSNKNILNNHLFIVIKIMRKKNKKKLNQLMIVISYDKL